MASAVLSDTRDGSYQLVLNKFCDEHLVVMATECAYTPARNELLLRYHRPAKRFISRRASSSGLRFCDVEEAHNETSLWILNAIHCYDTTQMGIARGCSFRTFLYRVLAARFVDFIRRLRCREKHIDRSWHVTAWVNGDTNKIQLKFALRSRAPSGSDDPVDHAERSELAKLIEFAHRKLTPLESHLWQLLARGVPLKQIGEQLGVSYDSAKRRRQKLLVKMRVLLRKGPA